MPPYWKEITIKMEALNYSCRRIFDNKKIIRIQNTNLKIQNPFVPNEKHQKENCSYSFALYHLLTSVKIFLYWRKYFFKPYHKKVWTYFVERYLNVDVLNQEKILIWFMWNLQIQIVYFWFIRYFQR